MDDSPDHYFNAGHLQFHDNNTSVISGRPERTGNIPDYGSGDQVHRQTPTHTLQDSWRSAIPDQVLFQYAGWNGQMRSVWDLWEARGAPSELQQRINDNRKNRISLESKFVFFIPIGNQIP